MHFTLCATHCILFCSCVEVHSLTLVFYSVNFHLSVHFCCISVPWILAKKNVCWNSSENQQIQTDIFYTLQRHQRNMNEITSTFNCKLKETFKTYSKYITMLKKNKNKSIKSHNCPSCQLWQLLWLTAQILTIKTYNGENLRKSAHLNSQSGCLVYDVVIGISL